MDADARDAEDRATDVQGIVEKAEVKTSRNQQERTEVTEGLPFFASPFPPFAPVKFV